MPKISAILQLRDLILLSCAKLVQWWQLCFSFELILISRGNASKDRICSAVKEIPLAQRNKQYDTRCFQTPPSKAVIGSSF